MKKKIAILAACSFVVLVLAGCGKTNSSQNNAPSAGISNSSQENNRSQNVPGNNREQGFQAEAQSACQGKNAGDSCQMTMPQRNDSNSSNASGGSNQISGTCTQSQNNSSQLICMPQGNQGKPGGPGGQGRPSPDANTEN